MTWPASTRELETLGVPPKDMKPPRGDNIRPGPAFWLVLIIIGGMTVWQKVIEPSKPVEDVRNSETISSMGAEHMSASSTPNGVYDTYSKRGI